MLNGSGVFQTVRHVSPRHLQARQRERNFHQFVLFIKDVTKNKMFRSGFWTLGTWALGKDFLKIFFAYLFLLGIFNPNKRIRILMHWHVVVSILYSDARTFLVRLRLGYNVSRVFKGADHQNYCRLLAVMDPCSLCKSSAESRQLKNRLQWSGA